MSLNELWEGAAGSPYSTFVTKDCQFFVGFTLLLTGKEVLEVGRLRSLLIVSLALILSGLFGLSENALFGTSQIHIARY
jgi:hypothetical protein